MLIDGVHISPALLATDRSFRVAVETQRKEIDDYKTQICINELLSEEAVEVLQYEDAMFDSGDGDVEQADTSEPTCVICQESLVEGEAEALMCGHAFHVNCLERQRQHGSSLQCAVCREPM